MSEGTVPSVKLSLHTIALAEFAARKPDVYDGLPSLFFSPVGQGLVYCPQDVDERQELRRGHRLLAVDPSLYLRHGRVEAHNQ